MYQGSVGWVKWFTLEIDFSSLWANERKERVKWWDRGGMEKNSSRSQKGSGPFRRRALLHRQRGKGRKNFLVPLQSEICIDSVIGNISQADELIRKIESCPSIYFGSCRWKVSKNIIFTRRAYRKNSILLLCLLRVCRWKVFKNIIFTCKSLIAFVRNSPSLLILGIYLSYFQFLRK